MVPDSNFFGSLHVNKKMNRGKYVVKNMNRGKYVVNPIAY